ncbi:TPA: hypothetical protein ACH3X3_013230 [Trebouxia sp. C0006]
MSPVLPLTMHMPRQLEELSDPSVELVDQKKHLCDFEQLPAHKSTDHLKMLLRHEIEKGWDASKHQRKLQEAGLLDRGRQQALSSLMQAFHVEDAGLGKHQKHAHDPEMQQYQHKTSAPRHVHAAMHKLHLRASKANSLAAEEQMKLAHQVVTFLLDDMKKGQSSKGCLARLQLLSKVSLEAVAEMHKKASQHAAQAMMALIPAAGQATRHAWLPNDGTDSFHTWPALTEELNEEMTNKASLLSGDGFDRLMRSRGQLIVSLAEHLEEPSVAPSPDRFLATTIVALHSIKVAPVYRLESRIEGRSMSTADIMADCKSAGKLVSMATDCDKPIIYSLTAQHDPGPYYSSDVVHTWWALARQKHQIMPLRKAVLAEIVAAVKLLVRCQQFSAGMAIAVSGHIRHHLRPALDWHHSDGRVYLEHAALLQLEPLQELLNFLWTHLSSKMQLLEPYIRAHQLLCIPSLDTPLSALEVHPDGTVQYSLQCLQELSTHSPSAQTSGSEQESDSRVLVTWKYCEVDALAQGALDVMLNSSPGMMVS